MRRKTFGWMVPFLALDCWGGTEVPRYEDIIKPNNPAYVQWALNQAKAKRERKAKAKELQRLRSSKRQGGVS